MAARLHPLLLLMLVAACGRTPPPTPSPPTDPGETITGRERLGWDQQAGDAAELATFRYALYVNGVRFELAEVTCGSAPGPAGFACSGRLPSLASGTHTLELAAFILDSGGALESARSSPLRVTVAGVMPPAPRGAPLVSGETVTTRDGLTLPAHQLAADLEDVVDIALSGGRRAFVAERGGTIRIVNGGASSASLALRRTSDGDLVSLAVDPEFSRTSHVFAIHAPPGAFRLVRYRLAGDALVDRAVLMRDVAASAEAAAALRFGPDGKLYVAFDDGGSRESAERASEWNGKILRLNPDGSTPGDQPAASPVFWAGLRAPRGLAWRPPDTTLWLTEQRSDRVDRLAAFTIQSLRPRRAAERASYPLPQPFGARAIVFHHGDGLDAFRGDLLIAASDAACVLRLRFEPGEPGRIATSERLLDGRIGSVRAVSVASDGAIYVAGSSALWRLSPGR